MLVHWPRTCLRKTTPDSFLRGGLADWLAARGIGHLVVCGHASEYCVDTSTRRTAGLGLAVTLAADAHTTHDKPHASGALIRAHFSTDPALCQRLAMDGKLPATVVVIHIEVVYFQCVRALLRSQLWNPATWPDRASLPTAGQMLSAATQGSFDGAAYDAALPQRQRDTLY